MGWNVLQKLFLTSFSFRNLGCTCPVSIAIYANRLPEAIGTDRHFTISVFVGEDVRSHTDEQPFPLTAASMTEGHSRDALRETAKARNGARGLNIIHLATGTPRKRWKGTSVRNSPGATTQPRASLQILARLPHPAAKVQQD